MTNETRKEPKKQPKMQPVKQQGIEIGLNAAIVALEQAEPMILTVPGAQAGKTRGNKADAEKAGPDQKQMAGKDSLPFGPFDPVKHRTMEMGVRGFVEAQTGLKVGYIEQLYTFGDRGRGRLMEEGEMHVVSIGYLALTRMGDHAPLSAFWRSWYRAFPWEDWRRGAPEIIEREIVPRLKRWAASEASKRTPIDPVDRINICFGVGGAGWDEEKVLDRYELLYEAGLVFEARRDGRAAALALGDLPRLGEPMILDHRRILATAMSRMRAKIKYRPVIFDMMPASFTLLQLQQSVEAISGNLLHKQNFRRLVEQGGLVVATGKVSSETGGRPAKLYRFRKEVLLERRTAGIRVRT